jgi:hypothetical protein
LNTLKMSDTSMDTPKETQEVKGNSCKVARPDLYYGDRNKLEEWILQFDLYFKFNGDNMDDDDYASFMASFMRGAAAKWVRPYLIKYMDDDNNEDEITSLFDNYLTFKEKLRQTFGILNEASNADRMIQRLHQTKSAADYAVLFQQYATQTDWDNKALSIMYRQGLKDTVKAELMRSGAQLDTLQQLINESIRIDNALRELYLETRPVKTLTAPNTSKPRYQGRKPQPRTSSWKTPGRVAPSAGTNWHDPDAMQLDNINKGNGFRKDKKQFSKSITCYNCQKEGHMARDCRSKNKVIRQLNMLAKDEGTDEEWNVVHRPTIQSNAQGIVSGLEDLTITTTGLDTVTSDDEKTTTKHEKQERFKREHRSATPCPEEFRTTRKSRVNPTYLDDKINELRRQLNKPEITFASPQDNIRIEFDKYDHYMELLEEAGQLQGDQALHTTQEVDWVSDATKAWEESQRGQKRKADKISHAPQDYYWMEPRNPNHANVSWTSCIYDQCTIHYSDKAGAGWYPSQVKGSPKCKWQWFDCEKDQCQVHLWDKRTRLYFPGHDDPQESLQMLTVYPIRYADDEAYECGQVTWHTCLNPDCDLHAIVKNFHGFKSKSFLGQQQDHKDPPRRSTQ